MISIKHYALASTFKAVDSIKKIHKFQVFYSNLFKVIEKNGRTVVTMLAHMNTKKHHKRFQ